MNFGFDILMETLEENQISKRKTKDKEKAKYESGRSPQIFMPRFTDDALIYHSILEYSLDYGTAEYFESIQLSREWLLKKCVVYTQEYRLKSRAPYKGRAEHINPTITKCLENLTYLDLLESRNVISTNTEDTKEYRFTKLGRLIALLIKQIKIEHPRIDEIYNQSLAYYDGLNNSVAKFCSIFFRKCYEKDRKLFGIIVNRLVETLLYTSNNKNAFMIWMKKTQAFYNHPVMWELFKESFDELGKRSMEHKNMFLYELKLEIEDAHEYKSRNLRSFEDLRCKVRMDQNLIAIEGYCKVCMQFIPCVVSLLDYLQSYVEEPDNSNRAECPNCLIGWLDFETEYL
jgi:hypothetical protein